MREFEIDPNYPETIVTTNDPKDAGDIVVEFLNKGASEIRVTEV